MIQYALSIVSSFYLHLNVHRILLFAKLVCSLVLPPNAQVAAESVRLYVAITDGVLILVDKVWRSFHYFS